jgi:hypothetical protein
MLKINTEQLHRLSLDKAERIARDRLRWYLRDVAGDPADPALRATETTRCKASVARAAAAGLDTDWSLRRFLLLDRAGGEGFDADPACARILGLPLSANERMERILRADSGVAAVRRLMAEAAGV